jgi:hypothetical protein
VPKAPVEEKTTKAKAKAKVNAGGTAKKATAAKPKTAEKKTAEATK